MALRNSRLSHGTAPQDSPIIAADPPKVNPVTPPSDSSTAGVRSWNAADARPIVSFLVSCYGARRGSSVRATSRRSHNVTIPQFISGAVTFADVAA